MKLRCYQTRAVDAIAEAFEENASTLIVLPTGAGKTIVFSHVAERMRPMGRIMVVAHREELITQAANKIEDVTGIKPDIEMADQQANEHAFFGQCEIVVASVQTLIAGNPPRMQRFNPDDFTLLITDEAHHAPAASYRRIYDWFHRNPNLKHLGVTATPDRADERALGKVYGSVAFDYEISDAVADGYLVPIKQRLVECESLDFSKIRTTAGDLNGKDLAQVMEYEQSLHEIAAPTLELTAGRRTLVFAASVAHAERLAEIFNRHDPGVARWVCGKTPKDRRRQILRDYTAENFRVLVNVGVFTEGFDDPGVRSVVLARPTKSRALYAQMVGRATRPLPGIVDGLEDAEERRVAILESHKPDCEIIDFVGNAGKHKLMTAADILGGKYDDAVVERAKAKAKKGEAVDVEAALFEAEKEIHDEKAAAEEAARRKAIKAKANYRTRTVDPFDVLAIEPKREREWDKGKQATHKQIDFLRRAGIELHDDTSRAHAGQLITEIFRRRENGLCTFKMAKLLQKYGYSGDLTMYDAKQTIDAIAANNWKRPDHLPEPQAASTPLEELASW